MDNRRYLGSYNDIGRRILSFIHKSKMKLEDYQKQNGSGCKDYEPTDKETGEDVIKKIAVLLLLALIFVGFWYFRKDIKLAGTLTEIPKYVEDFSITNCYKGSVQITEEEYRNVVLAVGETAYCKHPQKLNTLGKNQFYKTGRTDASSSTPEIVSKDTNGTITTTYEAK